MDEIGTALTTTATATANTAATPPQREHSRTAPLHVLARARVRSLAARPVGPMKVRRAQENPNHHQ